MTSNAVKYQHYGPYSVVEAEGARIKLSTCLRCGCVVLGDPRDEWDSYALHDAWHEASAVPGLRGDR
jgi:hypothetical protein